MTKVLASSTSILPYGMLLTTVFQCFGVNLDSESDVRMSKPSDNINNACITPLGYEHDGRRWVEKAARALTVVDVETDEEAEIPPPSLTAPPSSYSPPPAPSTAAGSSSASPNWYQ